MSERLKRLLWEWRGVWITAPSVAVLIILLRVAGLFQAWEWAAYDQYRRLRPPEPPDDRVAIVGLDEADLQELGATIPDRVYAQLIEKLKAMQPRAIGLDIYRDLPVEPGHQDLVKVFQSTPNLVGIKKAAGADSASETVNPPPELEERGQVGANDVIQDADNKVRRALLDLPDQNGETVFSFGLYLALLYLDAQGIAPQPVTEESVSWRLGKATFTPFEGNDGGYVRTNAGGFQVLLNYRGPSKTFETVSVNDILKNRVLPAWGRDRVILIGRVGETSQDFFYTPYSSSLVASPERMAGVEFHANVTSQILSAALDGRSLIKTLPEPVEWLWILLGSGIGSLLAWHGRYTKGSTKFSIQQTLGPVLTGAALIGSTYGWFLGGWWIPVVPPLLALAGSTIAITAYKARTAGRIRETFGRYLTDEVVANLLENPEGLKLGGERREITILTSDLRGFTATSERLPPEEVVQVLNLYLAKMADVITAYQGTIDEFLGDGILVLFGAPTLRDDDAQRAVACAVAMQLAMEAINEQMKQLGLPYLGMGIGINTGEVVVGNIGSAKRTKYGVVGNQVNLTYRIESYTIAGQILISQCTLDGAGPSVRVDSEKQVQPKGIRELITIHEVGGIGEPYNLFLPKTEHIFLPLAEQIPIEYAILEGKDVSQTLFRGNLVKLSAKGAEVSAEKSVAPLCNIKLNFLTFGHSDIYAKVLEKEADDGNFYIHFTSVPPDLEVELEAIYKSCLFGKQSIKDLGLTNKSMNKSNLTHYPYSSMRRVIMGRRGAVATSQPLATLAGMEMFWAGGNAVDAALAIAIALTVLEPTSNGIGSDAFALVWDGKLHGLNASGLSPEYLTLDQFAGMTEVPLLGWLGVTVPGAVSAWRQVWERWGKLPFEQLFAPAIRYAEEGFPVSPVTAAAWKRAEAIYLPLTAPEFQPFKAVFFPGDRAPHPGEVWGSEGHAKTLKAIAQSGGEDFYQGELAQQMAAFAAATGGVLTTTDLATHQADWVEPISTSYRDLTVWEIPPNGQGIAALIALNILGGIELARYPRESVESYHLQIEAMKLAFADAHRYVSDPRFMEVSVAHLLGNAYATERRQLIQDQAIPLAHPGLPKGGTVYLAAADGELMVSFIQSNFEGFGSGVLIPGTGIALHNRGTGFTLEAGHPNQIAPSKRPFHTIIPGFLTQGSQPLGPFGVMGGPMQPQGHLQVVVNLADYGLNPQAALDAPRWRFVAGNTVLLEETVPQQVALELAKRGHNIEVSAAEEFGRGQIILRQNGVLVAGSEPRSDGLALAW